MSAEQEVWLLEVRRPDGTVDVHAFSSRLKVEAYLNYHGIDDSIAYTSVIDHPELATMTAQERN